MPRTYTDSQKELFLAEAERIGITKAMRSLGYPNDYRTAQAWVRIGGIEPNSSGIANLASAARRLDRPEIVKSWMVKAESYLAEDLSPSDFAKLASAIKQLMETLQLVLGDATSRTENVKRESSEIDDELAQLAKQFSAKAANTLQNAAGTKEEGRNDTGH